MSTGGPSEGSDHRDAPVSQMPPAFKTHLEARSASWGGGTFGQDQTLSSWWAKGTGGPQTLAGHYR